MARRATMRAAGGAAMSAADSSAMSAARAARLREDVRGRAEDRPGVYRMMDEDGDCLYVGKSVRVRSRLLSYFRAPPGDKAADLVRATRSILWEYMPNEFGALVREMRLIRRWLPRYNVEHTRRPRYAFVKLTVETAPRLLPVDRVRPDGATYFGPFPRPAHLFEIVRELAHALGLRDCSGTTPVHFGDQLEIFARGREGAHGSTERGACAKPWGGIFEAAGQRTPRCLRAETGSCLAPCAGRCTEAEYHARVERARHFLEGRSHVLARDLRNRMREAATRRDFEYAALLRDRAERLSEFQKRMVAFRGRVEDLTFVYRVPGYRGNDSLYLVRRGLVLASERYPKGRKERRAVAARVEAAFAGPSTDPRNVTPTQAAEMLLVARWFGRRPNEVDRTWKPEDWLRERAG